MKEPSQTHPGQVSERCGALVAIFAKCVSVSSTVLENYRRTREVSAQARLSRRERKRQLSFSHKKYFKNTGQEGGVKGKYRVMQGEWTLRGDTQYNTQRRSHKTVHQKHTMSLTNVTLIK